MLVVHYKYLDTITSTITVDFKKNTVRVADYVDNVIDTAFGRYGHNHILTIEDFYYLLQQRCIPSDSYLLKEPLSKENLLRLIKQTHGCMASDYYSMEFVEIKDIKDVSQEEGIIYNRLFKLIPDAFKNAFMPCKGRHVKYKIADTWYKEDYFGYEAANSLFSSQVLSHARDEKGNRVEYVPYHIEHISDKLYSVSEDFLGPHGQLYSLSDLYLHIRGCRLLKDLSMEDMFLCLVSFMESELGMKDAGAYLTRLLEWDTFSLNTIRSANTIYIIRENDSFYPAPLFRFHHTWLAHLAELTSTVKQYEPMLTFARKHFGRQLFFDMDFDYESTFRDIENYYGIGLSDRLKNLYDIMKHADACAGHHAIAW